MIESIVSPYGFGILLLFFAAGGLGSLFFDSYDSQANAWGGGLAFLGSLYGLIFSSLVFFSGTPLSFTVPSTFPLLSATITIDPLSAFFIFLISLIAAPCSLYAIGYVRHYYKKQSIGRLGFFYNFFIASMLLVVSAHNALFFLIAWEIMSLVSYMLVVYENDSADHVSAGTLYLIMTHVGTACIILAFLLMYSVAGSFDFSAIRTALPNAPSLLRDAVFVLTLIGFGTKAGIIPFHIWLPSAHPAAPSHMSALMSGVMIKTGIYMLVRICFDFMPNAPEWWGIVLLIVGAVSSLLGVLYALAEHDIKRLLAYHSIENIGIILLGMGSALIFFSLNLKTLALIGLIAALYHTMNHATFKALLFLGAGSVISETHTRNIEEYGGLIKRMPFTAFCFLIGSMAISALPPLNGFASEWLTFQSLFSGLSAVGSVSKIALILSIGALAFTGGLAAACFVKAFGITFLARPRSEEAKHAREVSGWMKIGMAWLVLLTFVFGIGAGPIVRILGRIVESLSSIRAVSSPIIVTGTHVHTSFASISLFILFLGMIIAMGISYFFVRLVSRRQTVRIGRTWDCGTDLTPRMEITATGFSRSLIVIFSNILRPVREEHVDYHEPSVQHFPKKIEITLGLKDIYRSTIYRGLAEAVFAISEGVKKIQIGNVNIYVAYTFSALIALLIILVFVV